MIQVRNATYFYRRGSHVAVRDVSFELDVSSTLAIVGPNGSGKSTLGRLIKGLLFPAFGEVVVDGIDTRADSLEVRKRVGLVFQNPTSQIVNAVVEQEVAFGPENLGTAPVEIQRRVENALRAVRLEGMASVECQSLSMANKQRIAIASVIAMEPRYLVLDEPTAWIEPTNRKPVLEQVFRWGEANGVTIILVTHRMDEAQTCDRVIGMLDGRVEVDGPAQQVLRDVDIRGRLSLDIPDVLELADRLRSRGLPVTPGSTIEELADELTGVSG